MTQYCTSLERFAKFAKKVLNLLFLVKKVFKHLIIDNDEEKLNGLYQGPML
jgi:hypothetical protein